MTVTMFVHPDAESSIKTETLGGAASVPGVLKIFAPGQDLTIFFKSSGQVEQLINAATELRDLFWKEGK